MAKNQTQEKKEDRKEYLPDDFVAVRVGISNPKEIRERSYGEVLEPETINYRTLKPEKDGLFDERIFGPTSDFECYCGKYKNARYKGVTCEKCGVDVVHSSVRRKRMGHIELAAPVTHPWFLRKAPSRIAQVLGVTAKSLKEVVYFASYIILEVDEEAREETLGQLEAEFNEHVEKVKQEKEEAKENGEEDLDAYDEKIEQLEEAYESAVDDLESLEPKKVISEIEYRDLSIKFGDVFRAGIGAESVLDLLEGVDLNDLEEELRDELEEATKSQSKKINKRLKVIEGLIQADIKPEWLCMQVLPVIPPDLRPMVQLDGGRFATSDVNDLYRRVINRNNRLKNLIEIGAPDVIQRNEKRMLQEAVDALIDGSKRGSSNRGRQLKSLADMLTGKQGRFRRNLLGKRVDYSGRSVIVVGPELQLNECGVPKSMALELFKPFVMAKLRQKEIAHNIKAASKMVDNQSPEVWDALEEVIEGHHVLLNRAPTLHRLSIQAFQPKLVEGKAIQLHPMVCPPFNADFDGDQMAIHVPLSREAQKEAEKIMISTNNVRKPADGSPMTVPTQDMIMGAYYLTLESEEEVADEDMPVFRNLDEAQMAKDHGKIDYHTAIRIPIEGELQKTTLGRLLFNQVLPDEMNFVNDVVDKGDLKSLVDTVDTKSDNETTAQFIDDLKEIGFHYSTVSGATFSAYDLDEPEDRIKAVENADEQASEITGQYKSGLITEGERRRLVVEAWEDAKDEIRDMIEEKEDRFSPIHLMIDSGSRGSLEQLNQVIGLKGTVMNPSGEKIEVPIKSNLKEGLTALEYFISTHGARKGLADTALKTADAGYLTRRLVDVVQDIVVKEEDCETEKGLTIKREIESELAEPFEARIRNRFTAKPVEADGETIVEKDTFIDEEVAAKIAESDANEITARSPVTCQTKFGLCQKCYGLDNATSEVVKVGEPVGVIAAQSVGEPGTQLTMRTFHSGGAASAADITQGLPRVEQLFEARTPSKPAILAEGDGEVNIEEKENGDIVLNLHTEVPAHSEMEMPEDSELKVKDSDEVEQGDVLFVDPDDKEVTAQESGTVAVNDDTVIVEYMKQHVFDYDIESEELLEVEDGEEVEKGQQLTEGQYDLEQLKRLMGEEAVQRYIIDEAKDVYLLQGQDIDDKHLEVVLRQMFSKVRIKARGDSDLVVGETINRRQFDDVVERMEEEDKTPPKGENLLLGITQAALKSESFLSAASFQETTRVLVDAATMGKTDYLRGLKENVLIGRLIPAGTGYRLEESYEMLTEDDEE